MVLTLGSITETLETLSLRLPERSSRALALFVTVLTVFSFLGALWRRLGASSAVGSSVLTAPWPIPLESVMPLAILRDAAFFAERLGRAPDGLVPLAGVETLGILRVVGVFLGTAVDEDATAPFVTPFVN